MMTTPEDALYSTIMMWEVNKLLYVMYVQLKPDL